MPSEALQQLADFAEFSLDEMTPAQTSRVVDRVALRAEQRAALKAEQRGPASRPAHLGSMLSAPPCEVAG